MKLANIDLNPDQPGKSELKARWYFNSEDLDRFDRWLIKVIRERCGVSKTITPTKQEKTRGIADILILEKPPVTAGKIIIEIVKSHIYESHNKWDGFGVHNDQVLSLNHPDLQKGIGNDFSVELIGTMWQPNKIGESPDMLATERPLEPIDRETTDESKESVETKIADKLREQAEAEIPEIYKKMVEYWREGLSAKKISPLISLADTTINSRISDLRTKLKKKFGEEIALEIIPYHR